MQAMNNSQQTSSHVSSSGSDSEPSPAFVSPDYYSMMQQYISENNNRTSEFYRYFEVPGLAHCFGGNGGQPIHMFNQLRDWVENNTAPSSSPVTITRPDNSTQQQNLCAWPSKATFDMECAGTGLDCWSCE